MATTSILDSISSFISSHNPFRRHIGPSTSIVWLLDNTAARVDNDDGADTWAARFVAAFFVRRSGRDASAIVADISTKLGLAGKKDAEAVIRQRLIPLLNDIIPKRTIVVEVGGKSNEVADGNVANATNSVRIKYNAEPGLRVVLGPSDANGISKNTIKLPGHDYRDGDVINTTTVGDISCISGHTTFAGETGFAVISDIDDTIKKTLTDSAIGILRTTFVDVPEPIAGMPEFYKHMVGVLDNPPFWYLSASPYNLYPFLHEFRDQYYPAGTTLLRDASWMNLAGFLSSLSEGTQAYKVDHMKSIYETHPRRNFVCIGDSTQSDPEAYGEMYRLHPGWISAIFIRRVTGVVEATDVLPNQGDEERNKTERFEKAFQTIPREIWHVFSDPSELYEKLAEAQRRTV